MSIILTTLNARYSHASLGLRYLHANMGDLRDRTRVLEFVIGLNPSVIVERLLYFKPRILGFGVYIWNVSETTAVVALLRRVAPEVKIILGGPEVSHETSAQIIVDHADYVITGWGEISLPRLCGEILAGIVPAEKIHAGVQVPLNNLTLPYALYTDEDIAHRNIYVEASRGCPFKCEFCLSALDKTAWPFDLDSFLAEMEALHARGARRFKFVDRTFNLNIESSLKIMRFFLGKMGSGPGDELFAHFELIPDGLPDALKRVIAEFPPGTLQLEIGVQTLNPEVQALISRRQDNERSLNNIGWLREHSHAHLHADLIVGLPGEDMASFGRGFDQLYSLRPQEIQVGILKRLRGTPIIRYSRSHGLIFDPSPPYRILATDHIDFPTMQRLVRFGRYWDLVANSGRYTNNLPALLGDKPFQNFMAWSDWLYAQIGTTHGISPERLAELMVQWQPLNRMPGLNSSLNRLGDEAVKATQILLQRQARHLE